jgi:RNA polymerase sigma factor (sigma-70 family)
MARRAGDDGRFPATRSSAVRGVLGADPAERVRSRDRLMEVYWKPVYTYLRLRWNRPPAEAEELTQEFFLRCLDQDTFAAYQPERARFRTFLRSCLDRFVTDRHRRATALKRGGGDPPALDLAELESRIEGATARGTDPELLFEAEWARRVLALAVDRLRDELCRRGKERQARVFEIYHLGDESVPPSYGDIAEKLGVAVHDVTNWLSYARREFRRLALDTLREITASDDEFRDEARALFGPRGAANAGEARGPGRPGGPDPRSR